MNFKHITLISIFLLVIQYLVAGNINHKTLNILDGWQMRAKTSEKWVPAKVPGCVHSDLLQNNLIQEPYYRTNEKDLQWIDKKDWEYKTTFQIKANDLKFSNAEIVFKGLDTFADVYLNGKQILTANNMFLEWIVDVKPLLKIGENELMIYFHSPIKKGLTLLKKQGFMLHATNDQAENGGLQKDELVSPFIRKAPYHFGWDWGPRFVTSGIWQPVFISFWNTFKMKDLYVEQKKLVDEYAELNTHIEIFSDKNQQAIVEIKVNENIYIVEEVDLTKGENYLSIPFEIKNPKRWWSNGLGEAHLYRISVHVKAGEHYDDLSHNIGLRTLKLIQQPDSVGHSFYFELNGIPVFAKGANHIPNDMFLDKVTKEIYEWEIETAVKSNFNMIRVWGGGIYEDDYFYDLCDKHGLLVWQDFMFACSLYPGDEKFINSVSKEADYQVKRLRNHPSIALWCGNNEIDIAWQQFDKKGGWGWKDDYDDYQKSLIWHAYDTIFNSILPHTINRLSPAISYIHSSPLTLIDNQHADNKNSSGDVHYWGVWSKGDHIDKYDENIGRFMSEYGFQSLPELESVKKYTLPEDYYIESEVMRHHQRSTIGNEAIIEYMNLYYQMPNDFERFLYVGQVLQGYCISYAIEAHRRAMPYNMGSLYWQLNDCWPVASWSSCDYYKRWKALQYEVKRSFEPIIITAFEENNVTTIDVISDKLNTIDATLEMRLYDFSGRLLSKYSIPITILANAVSKVFESPTQDITSHPESTFISITLTNKDEVLSRKNYYFTNPKYLNLEKPTITSSIKKDADQLIITLETDFLAKDVYINFEGDEGFFEDNYFDLLPGYTKKVIYKLKPGKSPPKQLKVISLYDSYNN